MSEGPPPPPPRTSRFIALLFGVAALLLLPDRGLGEAASYPRAVQALVKAGWFAGTMDGDGTHISLADPSDRELADRRARIVAELRHDRADRRGLLSRHLDQPELWQLDGAAVTGFLFEAAPPDYFALRKTWRGEIAYATSPLPKTVTLAALDEGWRDIVLNAGADLDLTQEPAGEPLDLATRAVEPGTGSIPGAAIQMNCGGAPGALVFRIGDEVAVRQTGTGDACNVFVGERRLASDRYCRQRGIEADRCMFAVLRPGAVLRFEFASGDGGDRRMVRFQRRGAPGAAMVMRRNAELEKLYAPGLRDFIDPLANDLGEALNGCRGGKVTLKCGDTLTSTLEYAAQQDAHTLSQELAAPRSQSNPGQAAIVVMNALSGEVLAMDGFRSPARDGCGFMPLCLLPIGSVAKPVFAAAMVGADVRLAGLRVPYQGGVSDSILGLPIPGLNNSNGSGTPDGKVDLTEFIQHSDNYYAASLLLLASPAAAQPRCRLAGGNWYEISGRKQLLRPLSRFEKFAKKTGCTPLGDAAVAAFRPDWADKLEAFYDIEPYTYEEAKPDFCQRRYGSQHFDASPWRAIIDDDDHCVMKGSGIERNWLGIDSLHGFRSAAVPMILGSGERGHWNAVKLAEAYSRLVTGRRVWARFVAPKRSDKVGRIDGRDDDLTARIAVSKGMALVTRPGGTAAGTQVPAAIVRMEQRLASQGLRLGVFAKTGTMGLAGWVAKGCPNPNDGKTCEGRAFAIVLAAYPANEVSADRPVADASATPRCAITIIVNLPQYNGPGPNPGANLAARLIDGAVGNRLVGDPTTGRGGLCGARG